jgi:hypothetical protein
MHCFAYKPTTCVLQRYFGGGIQTKIPEPVHLLLHEYLTLMEQALPGFVAGFYIHGSVALGAFEPGFSDIDFITVASRRCTPEDIAHLTKIHRALEDKYPGCLLSGSYLQWSDLGQFEETIEPAPYYHDGVLHASGYNDVNAVTWWLLKHRGLAMAGPDPKALDFTVDWPQLIVKMRRNLNTYWVMFTRDPARIVWLFSNYGIQWTVLGVLRQFYTFREQTIVSKGEAGAYALDHLPARWHRLVQEALHIRKHRVGSLYRFRITRAIEAHRFLRYIIDLCNRTCA